MPSLAPFSSNTRKTPPTSNYSALSHLPSSLPSTPILYYVDQLGLPSRDRENKPGTYRVPHHRILFVRMGILHSDLCPSQLFLLFKVVKEQKRLSLFTLSRIHEGGFTTAQGIENWKECCSHPHKKKPDKLQIRTFLEPIRDLRLEDD